MDATAASVSDPMPQLSAGSPRAESLLAEIDKVEREAGRYARRYDWGNRFLWWSGLGLVWSSAVLGVVGHLPPVAAHLTISAWMVGLGTAVGAGLETFRRRSFWRQLADAYWDRSIECWLIRTRYHYRMDEFSEDQRIHDTYDDFVASEDRFGDERDRIIEQREKGGDHAPSQARRQRQVEREKSEAPASLPRPAPRLPRSERQQRADAAITSSPPAAATGPEPPQSS